MDYSSNMNIIVTVISIIINSMGSVDYLRLFISCSSVICGERKGGDEGVKFVVGNGGWRGGSQEKAMTTHMKNSGDEGLSLVEPASRNPLLAPDPVSFSHLSL